MRKRALLNKLLLVMLAGCCVGTISAAPLCIDVGVITLDRLISGDLVGGCIVDDKLFDNFSYAVASQGGGATVPSASSITVTPLLTPFNPGLRFTSFWAAGPGSFADSTLGYTVTVLPGGNLITDNSLLMAGGHTGTGIAAIEEVKCVGGTFADDCLGGNLVSLHTTHSAVAVVPFDRAVFAGVSVVDVVKNIGVVGGVDGTATITTFDQRYSEVVPEPGTLLLVGLALMSLRLLRRRV